MQFPSNRRTISKDAKSFLNRTYGNAGRECSNILRALNLVDDLYFDAVSQIQIQPWSKGRVVLIGDAAACVSCRPVRGLA
jgi:2-polyprenyl-6-methoxyphenol hydroxylase-like FAD-dependent oxidoreductase